MTTLHDRFCAGLIALGYARVPEPATKRYTVFADGKGGRYYVGRAGALRHSDRGTIADSHPMLDIIKRRVIKAGEMGKIKAE